MIAVPDVVRRPIGPEDEFVVLACDGVFDCKTSQEVVDFIRVGLVEPSQATTNLVPVMDGRTGRLSVRTDPVQVAGRVLRQGDRAGQGGPRQYEYHGGVPAHQVIATFSAGHTYIVYTHGVGDWIE